MGRTARITITLPRELVCVVDQIARERKMSRSKIIAACLRELAEKTRVGEMAEGYRVMAKELQEFAAIVSEIADEAIRDYA
ncbi:MAG: ribbon-helix-helix protein, CopG family [Chloroflexi bacterium]|nr:ribbon-helix-helix protein, CopG family [Chloroflexota bacterium]